jgi:hypothetical protein
LSQRPESNDEYEQQYKGDLYFVNHGGKGQHCGAELLGRGLWRAFRWVKNQLLHSPI